jgi:hypothetical protein
MAAATNTIPNDILHQSFFKFISLNTKMLNAKVQTVDNCVTLEATTPEICAYAITLNNELRKNTIPATRGNQHAFLNPAITGLKPLPIMAVYIIATINIPIPV